MAQSSRSASFARDVVVIGGCGHVGLPLAIAFASRGARLGIFDISETAVASTMSPSRFVSAPRIVVGYAVIGLAVNSTGRNPTT